MKSGAGRTEQTQQHRVVSRDAWLAERKALLKQLAKADTPNETASIRGRLRIVSGQIAQARGELRGLRERANFAKVTVSVNPKDGTSDDEGGAGSERTPELR